MLLLPKLDERVSTPQYLQLYDYLKQEIVSGRVPQQTRLPSVRKLADFLSISTTPVEMAYNQLLDEGFIESRPRSGYYVQKLADPYLYLEQAPAVEKRSLPLQDEREYRYDFHLSKNDFTDFPFQLWRRLFNQLLRQEQKELLFYGNPQGEPGLRREIAKYLRQFRGVVCSPEQIVVSADQYQLLIILSLILGRRCKRVGVENPGYPLFSSTFHQQGLQVVPISLEHDGICLSELYQSNVQMVCVSPSHQFPRGMIMPITKRLQLLEWAKEVDGYIIEDDYDGEFRYHGRPIPSLQGLLPSTNVVYLGGFSQVLAPALCVSYMVLPKNLLDIYADLYWQTLFEQSSSRLHQATLQLFMERGYLAKHVRKMRNSYRKKHDRLLESVEKHFAEKAVIIGKDAGFHVLLQVNSPKTEQELGRLAKEAGIRVSSASFTWADSLECERKEFFLGFGGIDIEQIEPGIKLLHDVWFEA